MYTYSWDDNQFNWDISQCFDFDLNFQVFVTQKSAQLISYLALPGMAQMKLKKVWIKCLWWVQVII